MPDLTIAPLARADLKEIGLYTQERWGVRRRDGYLGAFATRFGQIRAGTVAGRLRPEIRPGILSCPCHRHVIFFRRDGRGNVEILRILHQRMDVRRHV